jgi:hypothetical protein
MWVAFGDRPHPLMILSERTACHPTVLGICLSVGLSDSTLSLPSATSTATEENRT